MADDLTAEVTIRNESTGEEKSIPKGAVPFFVNDASWVELTSAGHRKPASTSTTKDA